MVYLDVDISSTSGFRNVTFFSARNIGRFDILRGVILGCIALLTSMELRTCEMEYGIVAELQVDPELAEEEVGVLESSESLSGAAIIAFGTELLIDNFGLVGRPVIGTGADVRTGS